MAAFEVPTTGLMTERDSSLEGAPLHLRCEYLKNPLGIDATAPRFFWWVKDPRRGALQRAYHILVSDHQDVLDRNEGHLWDSGKVLSDRSTHVVYKGKLLESMKTYFWKVRTWDAFDAASPWSEPASFGMGLLHLPRSRGPQDHGAQDWSAKWISLEPARTPAPVRMGSWIWSPKGGDRQHVFFRATLELPNGESGDPQIEEALMKVTADDHFTLYVNGALIGSGQTWSALYLFNLSPHLKAGKNLIAIEGFNKNRISFDEFHGAGPAGLVVGLYVKRADQSFRLASGPEWRVSTQQADGWQTPDFDDASWERARVVAEYGQDPWGVLRERYDPRRSCLFRKEITLAKVVQRARLYASGLGCYHVRINGTDMANQVFAPGWTHYGKRLQYQTYDLTAHLRRGPNALGLILGNGWWSGGLGIDGFFVYSPDPLHAIAQLEIDYTDGSRERFVTDPTWKAHPAPILSDSLYLGERYDARLELPGWDQPGFNDQDWSQTALFHEPVTHLVAEPCEPIRMTQELPVRSVTRLSEDRFVLDFGQNFAGCVRLKVKGPRGTEVKLRFAEILHPDGTLSTANLRTAQATDVYILKGEGEEFWQPRFTYHGFRYVEVTGYPGEPKPEHFVGLVLHTDAPVTGSFRCANDLLNRIHDNVVWTLRSNLYSVPTDCPQRDERLGWLDTQLFAPTACLNRQLAPLFTKWMHDIVDSQGPDGATTDVAPAVVVRGPAAPGWGDAITIIPWIIYERYGDTRLLEAHYDAMKAWVEYMRRLAPSHLYEREAYGDWVAPVPSPSKPMGTAYYYRSTQLLARMAQVLGRTEDAKTYLDLSEKIAAAFHNAYFDEQTNWYEGKTQHANLLPLHFEMVPQDRRQDVLAQVVADLIQRDYHLSTGFTGTACLLQGLAKGGHQDLAYTVATQRTYPSWGYMIDKGATTIWELWDGDQKGPEMNSYNHFALGTIDQWLYEHVAGIQADPTGPGFHKILIHPRPPKDLAWAEATHDSLYGPIHSTWHRTPEGLSLEVSIPPNTSAKVFVPLEGHENGTIREGETLLARAGRPVPHEGQVQFEAIQDDCAVFHVGAGAYIFRVSPD